MMTVKQAVIFAEVLEQTKQTRLLSAEACIVLMREIKRLKLDKPEVVPREMFYPEEKQEGLCLTCAANRYELTELLEVLNEVDGKETEMGRRPLVE